MTDSETGETGEVGTAHSGAVLSPGMVPSASPVPPALVATEPVAPMAEQVAALPAPEPVPEPVPIADLVDSAPVEQTEQIEETEPGSVVESEGGFNWPDALVSEDAVLTGQVPVEALVEAPAEPMDAAEVLILNRPSPAPAEETSGSGSS